MLIEIEGNELTGKTTLCNAVREELGGDKCTIVKFPNRKTDIGNKAADIIDARTYTDKTEFLAMIADFQYSKETIIDPELYRGKVVLLDRARGSTEVYQYQLGGDIIQFMWEEFLGYKPDWTYVLDADVESLFERRKNRDDPSSFDEDNHATFQLRRRRYLEWVYRQPSASVLDANATIETLVKCVTHMIKVKSDWKLHRSKYMG